MDVLRSENPAWVYYVNRDASQPAPEVCGKWMLFFRSTEAERAEAVIRDAVASGAFPCAKRTSDFALSAGLAKYDSIVCCLYLDGTDDEAQREAVSYLIANGLVGKTRAGRYRDLPFKFDTQTLAGEYGSSFTPKIRLSDFIDLETGSLL